MKRIVLGLLVIAVSEIGMLLKAEPFWSWHTPIAWTGYILLVDGLVWRRRGTSWLSDSPKEFALLAFVSFPLWLVFEFYNLLIRNWHYINLPDSALTRNVGYAWAFATIWPAIFETADLVASYRQPGTLWSIESARSHHAHRDARVTDRFSTAGVVSLVVGAVMLTWPIVAPSAYLAAPVWLGFILLLDPVNARAGRQSLIADYRRSGIVCFSHLPGEENKTAYVRRIDRAINLALAGLICGFVWEFWNYWARTKWIYTVPILSNVKLFEMPLPGYLGFPAFALECFTMYVTVRLLLGRPDGRPIAL